MATPLPKIAIKDVYFVSPNAGDKLTFLRDILRRVRFNFLDCFNNYQQSLGSFKNLHSLLVIDDPPTQSSTLLFSQFIQNPLGCLIPKLILISEDNPKLMVGTDRLGGSKVCRSPFTPQSIGESLSELRIFWHHNDGQNLLQVRGMLSAGEMSNAVHLLRQLCSGKGPHARLALTCLAALYSQNSQLRTAEKLLLAAIKAGHQDLNTVMMLSRVYLASAMPHLSKKLMLNARRSFGSSPAVLVELYQAFMMLGEINAAIAVVRELHQSRVLPKHCATMLARLLFVDGRADEVAPLIQQSKIKVADLEAAWSTENEATLSEKYAS